jgi:peptide/nickel transport system permease protein
MPKPKSPTDETVTEPSATLDTLNSESKVYVASQWQLMWWRFRKHKLALAGGILLVCFYVFGAFANFLAPYEVNERSNFEYAPPQRLRFFDQGRFYLCPFVYGILMERDPETLRKMYEEDRSQKYQVRFLVHGYEYELWGLFPMDLHLFGIEEGGFIYLFGTDKLGRDAFSRNIHASITSLTVGLLGVCFSFVLGCILGGISGYYGGTVDVIVQRIIEFIRSIPTIPLWMALSAALPPHWPSLRVYFGVTVILSLVGWCSLARVVRGKLLQLKEEDFVIAARLAGTGDGRIIARHLLPSFLSYLIVSLTLSIPSMILGETSLSFLGLGLRPPVVSWGVLLQEAQNVRTLAIAPWLLIPGIFVVVAVLSLNFLGDGLRDAADPYAR